MSDALSATQPRDTALDGTKGALVVFMVIYHSINYTTQYYEAFRLLAFLPPSFILITGFLLTHVYRARRDAGFAKTNRRLLLRGARLLALFTVLNLAASYVRSGNVGGSLGGGPAQYLANWYDVYVVGSGRVAVFEVLVPISYLLLAAPILLWLDRLHRFAVPLTTMATVFALAWLNSSGAASQNFNLMSAGLVGMCVGRTPGPRLQHCGRYWITGPLLYAGYATIAAQFGQTYLIQLLGAVVALALIYMACTRIGPANWISRRLAMLGAYSLPAYVGQIVILQIIVRLAGKPELSSSGFYLQFGGTLVLTVVMVELMHVVRRRSARFDVIYRAAFA